MEHRFGVGDWVYIIENPTSHHVQDKLHRVEKLTEGGYLVSNLADLSDASTHIPERMATDGSNGHYILTVQARIMGIPDNLALAEYIQNLERRLSR